MFAVDSLCLLRLLAGSFAARVECQLRFVACIAQHFRVHYGWQGARFCVLLVLVHIYAQGAFGAAKTAASKDQLLHWVPLEGSKTTQITAVNTHDARAKEGKGKEAESSKPMWQRPADEQPELHFILFAGAWCFVVPTTLMCMCRRAAEGADCQARLVCHEH